MAKLSCAIVGLGFWGKIFFKKLSESSDFDLVAVASRSGSPQDLGQVQLFRTSEDLIKNCDFDVLFVLTSLDQHMKIAQLALKKSINVFLTKPITFNRKDAESLKALARKNKAQIFVDHTFLFNPDFLKFKAMLSKQKIKGISSERVQFGRFQKNSDVLGELLYHDIYMSLSLLNDERPKSILALGTKVHNSDLDQCHLEMKFKGDTSAELVGSMNFIHKQKIMSVTTATKIFSWQDMAPSVFNQTKFKFAFGQEGKLGAVKAQTMTKKPKRDALEHMLGHVAKCLRSGKKSDIIGIDQGIEIMRIIDAARKSVELGKRVKI